MKYLYFLALLLLFTTCEWNLPDKPLPCPTITELSPNSAAMEESIIIRGANFFFDSPNDYEISIAGQPINTSNLTWLSKDSLKLKIPQGTPSGELQIKFKDQVCIGTNASSSFEYKFTATNIKRVAGEPEQVSCVTCLKAPSGLDIDQNGNVFFTERGHHVIRKISPSESESMTIIAGQKGKADCLGNSVTGLNAKFNFPTDLAIDPTDEDIYVSDFSNSIIRKIENSSTHPVPSIPFVGTCGGSDCASSGASSGGITLRHPNGIVFASGGTLFFTDENENCGTVFRVKSGFVNIEVDETSGVGDLSSPKGLDLRETSTVSQLFIADSGNGRVLQKENGSTIVLCKDSLISPVDIAFDGQNTLFILDDSRNQVFSCNLNSKPCIPNLIAGNGMKGYDDGENGGDNPLTARFNSPQGLAFDRKNNILYIADTDNHVIRQITLR